MAADRNAVLDLSPAKRIGGGVKWWANLLAIFQGTK